MDGIPMKITGGSTVVYDNKMSTGDTMSSGNTQNLVGDRIGIHTKYSGRSRAGVPPARADGGRRRVVIVKTERGGMRCLAFEPLIDAN